MTRRAREKSNGEMKTSDESDGDWFETDSRCPFFLAADRRNKDNSKLKSDEQWSDDVMRFSIAAATTANRKLQVKTRKSFRLYQFLWYQYFYSALSSSGRSDSCAKMKLKHVFCVPFARVTANCCAVHWGESEIHMRFGFDLFSSSFYGAHSALQWKWAPQTIMCHRMASSLVHGSIFARDKCDEKHDEKASNRFARRRSFVAHGRDDWRRRCLLSQMDDRWFPSALRSDDVHLLCVRRKAFRVSFASCAIRAFRRLFSVHWRSSARQIFHSRDKVRNALREVSAIHSRNGLAKGKMQSQFVPIGRFFPRAGFTSSVKRANQWITVSKRPPEPIVTKSWNAIASGSDKEWTLERESVGHKRNNGVMPMHTLSISLLFQCFSLCFPLRRPSIESNKEN